MISPRPKTRLAVAATLAVPLMGCGAGWHRSDLGATPLAPRQQVQVWRQGVVTQWHRVLVASDSISGIPYFQPLECDSCRRSFPLTSVDSLRVGNPVAGFWKSVGLVVGGMFAVCLATCPREMN